MGTLVADLVLVIASYFAQSEREAIRQRQAEGIVIAKAKGVRFGAKPKEPTETFAQVREEWTQGKLSAREAGRVASYIFEVGERVKKRLGRKVYFLAQPKNLVFA